MKKPKEKYYYLEYNPEINTDEIIECKNFKQLKKAIAENPERQSWIERVEDENKKGGVNHGGK